MAQRGQNMPLVQLLCRVKCFETPWTAAHPVSVSITNSWGLLKFMSIESVMPPNHLILCHPLFLLSSNFPSIRVLSNESVLCIRWPKYWSFSFSITLSIEYSDFIFFRIDWFELLTVQGTLKSLLQLLSVKLKKIPSILFYQRIIFNHKWMLKSFIHLFQICRDGIICGFSLLFHC